MASIDRVLGDGRMSLMRSHMHQLAILYSYTVKRESLSGKKCGRFALFKHLAKIVW